MIEPQDAPPAEKKVAKFDVSSIDPAKDFMCFGTIEVGNQECNDCPSKDKCAEKAGVKL